MTAVTLETAAGLDGHETAAGTVQAGVLRRDGPRWSPDGTSFWPAGVHAPRDVALTRRLFCHALSRRPDDLRLLHQVHGTTVHRRYRTEAPGTILRGDGHFTLDSDPVLVVNIADCCPVILVSDEPAAIGIAHSGWRGSADGVVAATVAVMEDAGVDRARLRAWIGPCAEGSRYEVGEEVAHRFERWAAAVAPHPRDPRKRLLDVPRVIADQLQDLGVAPAAIQRHHGGTIGDRRYHSHRRDRFAAGRMAAYVTVGRPPQTWR